MEHKAKELFEKLIHKGDDVIVALSGGADSVALFHFLLSKKDEMDLVVSAAHFEHGWREETSKHDAEFVKELCEHYDVSFFIEHGEMQNKEKPKGESFEEWARKLRYEFLKRTAKKRQENSSRRVVVALAHTASDNAETVLFHMARGTGPKGLSGIPEQRECFVRPLLQVSRDEVEEYCRGHGLSYQTDETNKDVAYSRNRIRHCVLPQLQKVHPGARDSILRVAHDMKEISQLLDAMAEEVLCKAADEDSSVIESLTSKKEKQDFWLEVAKTKGFSVEVISKAPIPVQKSVFSLLLGKNANHVLLKNMEDVLQKKVRATDLQNDITAQIRKNRLYFQSDGNLQAKISWQVPFSIEEHCFSGGYTLCLSRLSEGQKSEDIEKTKKKGYIFVADYDKIYSCSVFRTRRVGDVFAQAGRHGSKTVKKWMNEMNVPPNDRNNLPLLANGSEVLWIWGGGISQSICPDKFTKRYLQIEERQK